MAGVFANDVARDLKPASGISCEECGIRFDSITSLEVHIAYHKDKLLDKWRQQASLPTATNHNLIETSKRSTYRFNDIQAGTFLPQQQLHTASDSNSYLAMNGTGHNVVYLPPYSRSNGQLQSPPPHLSTNILPSLYPVETTEFYNGNYQSPTYSFHMQHPERGFATASDHISMDLMDHQNKHEKINSTDAAAEILDLDSNTVHVINYNMGDRSGNLYRPFLNGNGNGPPNVLNWASASPHQDPGVTKGSAPPPREPLLTPAFSQPSIQPAQILVPRQEIERSNFVSDLNPEVMNVQEQQRNDQPSPTDADKDLSSNSFTSESTPSNSKSSSSATKVKGWKGGECKRPKTYNCTACNKWFTSSGHLKRHYGTTLHKNSIRQLGEEGTPDQGSKPPPKQTPKNKRNSVKKNGDTVQAPANADANANPKLVLKEMLSSVSQKSTADTHEKIAGGAPGNGISPKSPDMQTSSSNSSNDKVMIPLTSENPLPAVPGLRSGTVYEEVGPTSGGYNYAPFPTVTYPSAVATHTIASPVIGDNHNGMYPMGRYDVLNGINGSLPPFSAVGYSHYDPQLLNHFGTNLGQHYPALAPTHAGLNGPLYYTTNPMVTSPFVTHTQGSRTEHAAGSPEPEVARSALDDIDCSGFDNESSTNDSPSRDMVSTSSGEDSPREDVTGIFRCEECSKTFARGCYLTQHINSAHAGLQPFKCTKCGKKFMEQVALEYHVRKHGSDKPFRCEHDQCLKQFNHKTDLRRHLCLHTGEKPFSCKGCGKGFIRKDHMTKHSEIHRKKRDQKPLPDFHN